MQLNSLEWSFIFHAPTHHFHLDGLAYFIVFFSCVVSFAWCRCASHGSIYAVHFSFFSLTAYPFCSLLHFTEADIVFLFIAHIFVSLGYLKTCILSPIDDRWFDEWSCLLSRLQFSPYMIPYTSFGFLVICIDIVNIFHSCFWFCYVWRSKMNTSICFIVWMQFSVVAFIIIFYPLHKPFHPKPFFIDT